MSTRVASSFHRQKRSFAGIILLVALGLLLFFLSAQAGGWFEKGVLRIWVFDVGQGDAILVQAPTGEELLVDAGPGSTVLTKLGQVLPPWDRHIDSALLTHPHADHLEGFFGVFDAYEVSHFYETGQDTRTLQQDHLDTLVEKEQTLHTFLQDGAVIPLGDVQIRVIAPDRDLQGVKLEDPNAGSLVLLVTYGGTSLLLTGDATDEGEPDMFVDLPEEGVDVLKVAHHGSRFSTTTAFLERVHPTFAVVSLGEGNSYEHPHPALLARLKTAGIPLFRTDRDRDILIRSNGGEPTIIVNRLPF